MIDILTSRVEMNLSLFAEEMENEEAEEGLPASFEDTLKAMKGEMPEPTEMLMEGKLLVAEHRVELVYAESELTGMQGSLTAIGFEPANPDLVSMVRTGPVRTAMTFEEGKRHICLYNTPFPSSRFVFAPSRSKTASWKKTNWSSTTLSKSTAHKQSIAK